MQKFIACFVCILALLAAAMPVIIAEDKQNSTGNSTLNQTQNITENVTLNETENASQNIALDGDRNATQSMTEGAGQNTAQIGVSASQHTKVLRAGFEKTKPLNNLDVYGNKSTYNIPSSGANSAFNAQPAPGKYIQNHLQYQYQAYLQCEPVLKDQAHL